MTRRFDEAMRLMRQHDPALMEDGFGLLRGHAGEHIEELIAEFGREENDHGLRCWLLELSARRGPNALSRFWRSSCIAATSRSASGGHGSGVSRD
jgi:hypothetical protein